MGDAFQYKMGLNHVGAYAVSGIPWVSGGISVPISSSTPLEISFPFVTKRVVVHVTNAYTCRVGFSANGVKLSNNYFIADGDVANNGADPYDMNVKCTKIYLLSNDGNTPVVSVAAELTGIPSKEYPLATAYSGAAGIG